MVYFEINGTFSLSRNELSPVVADKSRALLVDSTPRDTVLDNGDTLDFVRVVVIDQTGAFGLAFKVEVTLLQGDAVNPDTDIHSACQRVLEWFKDDSTIRKRFASSGIVELG